VAGYPELETVHRVDSQVLTAAVTRIFAACGMPHDDALLLADSLVWADLRGIHSHGVLRVPEYVLKLTRDGVNPQGRPAVVRDSGAALVIDGGNSMGQIGAAFAMRAAIERARGVNVAVAAVRGSNHCGAMAYYTSMALPHRMFGIAATNALPTMAPWGGLDKIVGINPLAVSIPAGREQPVVLDCAFSGSSHGKIRVFHQLGQPIPPQWAFDRTGRPTTDPAAAIEGLLQPIGEYKGVGLAIVFGLLSTLLSGAAYGTGLGNMVDGPRPGADGHIFLALRVEAFTAWDAFAESIDAAVRQIRQSRPAMENTVIHAPGGIEADLESRYRNDGIPLNELTLSGLRQCAAARGVEAPF